MLGLSQLQSPQKDSNIIRVALYSSSCFALHIATIPLSIMVSLASIVYSTEIKTLLGYQKIKGKEKISKKEYWKMFGQDNVIKSILASLAAASIIYYSFSKVLILVWILGTVPLAAAVVLLQFETRPEKIGPISLLKASLILLSNGLYENLVGTQNLLNVTDEHMLPHSDEGTVNASIDALREKYGSSIPGPENVKDDNFTNFIQYIRNNSKFSHKSKEELIEFLNKWSDDFVWVHASSGLTGGQILHLILKACNSSDGDISAKKEELLKSLSYALNYAKGTIIPETCFQGVIGAMLKSLEGIEPSVYVYYHLEESVGSHVDEIACNFIIKDLKKNKNQKKILNAWDKSDEDNRKIVHDFIKEITIPLMKKLFSAKLKEQRVIDLINNPELNLYKFILVDEDLIFYIARSTNIENIDGKYRRSLFQNVKGKIFLELLNKDLLKTDFSLKDSSLGQAREIANKIIKEEIARLKLRAKNTLASQVSNMLSTLSTLPQERKCYRIYTELCCNDKNSKQEIKKILQERLEIKEEELDYILKGEASSKLESEIENAYESNCKKIEEVKKEFVKNGLLTVQEVNDVVEVKIIDLSKKDKTIPSSKLSRSAHMDNIAGYCL
ncbi:MAG: hypothetical protein QWI36_00975 [Wolbachia endosymbiont of Tyrophagus putrescentiae]|nr:hypothetical protein [Wolbachia endosymbiont of Tyrophagus putrescentiae]